LDASALTDVSAIAELTSLTSLQLHVRSAPKLPGLENLSGIKTFWISSDAATDFSSLADLREVEELWISAAQFNDLKKLSSLANLKSLTIANSGLSSLDSLKELSAQENLEHFQSVNNPISNGEPLAGLSGLKSLAIVGSNIRNTGFLANLSQLQSLDLSQNPGIDVSYVQQKTGLKYLNIAASGLTQTDFLDGLTSLETFNAPYNQIAAVPQLKNLKNLVNVNLSGNRLSQTYDLSDLSQVQILFLNDNPIAGQVEGLLGMQSLEVLGLARTGLTGKPAFPSWKRLKIFDVSDNSINNILAFGELTDLESLYIANNQVRDFGPIVGASVNGSLQNVKILPWLHELRTDGNPVPFSGIIPSDAAISMLNSKGKDLHNDLINAEYNYDKVALLHHGGEQVTQDIICLRVYYHFKYMGVLNSAILASNPEKVGTLNDYLMPLCTDDSCRASDNPIKFVYGQDLDGCKQLGSVKNLSPDIKPIVSIGKTNTVKLSPKYASIEANARQEALETSTIKMALDKLFKSQSNASGSIREVQEAFIRALDQARDNAQDFLARVDRIRVSNHGRLQEAREKLREKFPSDENN
jgi:Leucine-rich repeat (LRR) protein